MHLDETGSVGASRLCAMLAKRANGADAHAPREQPTALRLSAVTRK
ncbi:hypothetical protein J8I87_27205 [Paraburkholderia sp. LEh10]|nr:hypothetical protein [Paraburkholderia sp. LEh10]MBP0593325.1 hypothetical protein [Paraburkholderia sp. LEh10]